MFATLAGFAGVGFSAGAGRAVRNWEINHDVLTASVSFSET